MRLTQGISFCFIIPSYNNEDNLSKNLLSVLSQTYPQWRIIYINDNSTDRTDALFHELMAQHETLRARTTYVKNDVKRGQMYNKFRAYKMVDDLEVVCLLDGDDWLCTDDALELLRKHYATTTDKLCTSNYRIFYNNAVQETDPNPPFYTATELAKRLTRYSPNWYFRHLKTGYGILFKSIPPQYLTYEGRWLDVATDCAEMHAAVELGRGKVSQLPHTLYVYNKDNSVKYATSYYNSADCPHRKAKLAYLKSLPRCEYQWPYAYVINLKREVFKKIHMLKQLSLAQIYAFEFVEAVEGDPANLEAIPRQPLPSTKLYYNPTKRHVTPGALGLLQSTFKTLTALVASQRSHALILEDDVYSLKDLKYFFFLRAETLEGKDVVYLGCHHNKEKVYENANDRDVFLSVNHLAHQLYGTYAYVISRRLALFILDFGVERVVELNLSIDLFLNFIRDQYPQFTYYLYFKQLFVPDVSKDGINGKRDHTFYTERDIELCNYHTF